MTYKPAARVLGRIGLGLAVAGGLSLTASLDACRIDAPAREPRPVVEGPLAGARFFARTADGREHPLTLRRLAVEVTIRPGTVRSHLTMEVVGPPAVDKAEAVVRLAIPRGAALTGAVLWVDGHPQNGAFVERERARGIYRSIVAHRRDPALVTWDGPGWIAVSIFPLDSVEPRRLELEWVEPAAIANGFVQYRAPTVAEGDRILARAPVTLGGRRLTDADLIPLVPAVAGEASIVDGQAPGDPFHRLLVRAPPPTPAPRIVLLAETSVAVTAVERIRQRAILDALLGGLPRDAKVSVLAADWDLSTIATETNPIEAERSLARLDAIPSAGGLHLERALTGAAARVGEADGGVVLFVGHGADAFWGDALAAPLAKLRSAGMRLSVVGTDQAASTLADAAALTGGEAWASRGLEGELGSIVRALSARPARPAVTARGLDGWRPLETVTGQTVWIGRALEAPPAEGAASIVRAADPRDLLPLWDRARLFTAGRDGRSNPEAAMPLALTPLRALLVLERSADYAREGLEAPAAAEATLADAQIDVPPAKEGLYGLRGGSPPDPALAARLADEQVKNAQMMGMAFQALGGRAVIGRDASGVGAVGTGGGTSGFGSPASAGYSARDRETAKSGRSDKRAGVRPQPPNVPTPVAAGAPDGDLPATEALAILSGPGPLPDRVSRVAVRLGLDDIADPESLAWTLDRHAASRNRIILIARLLVAAERPPDAIRVLSEHAPFDREAIGAEMRRLGADADAAELLSLAERSP